MFRHEDEVFQARNHVVPFKMVYLNVSETRWPRWVFDAAEPPLSHLRHGSNARSGSKTVNTVYSVQS